MINRQISNDQPINQSTDQSVNQSNNQSLDQKSNRETQLPEFRLNQSDFLLEINNGKNRQVYLFDIFASSAHTVVARLRAYRQLSVMIINAKFPKSQN